MVLESPGRIHMTIIERLENILYIALCIFQFLLSLTIFVAVVARYVFKFPIPEVNIVQNFSLVWLIMLGAGIALKHKEHLDIDIIGPYLSEKAAAVRYFLIDIIVLLAVLLLVVVGYKAFLAGFTRSELTPIRFLDHRITLVYFNSAFLFGALTMLIYQVVNVAKTYIQVMKTYANRGAK